MLKKIISLALATTLLAACSPSEPSDPSTSTTTASQATGVDVEPTSTTPSKGERFTKTFIDLFDTMTQIVAYSDDQVTFDAEVEALQADLKHYHQLYNTFLSYEGVVNLRTVNQHAGQGPIEVAPEIIDLLKFSKEMYTLTHGEVNIAMGAVLELWHDAREYSLASPEDAYIPDEDALKAAAEHANIDDLIIDEAASTVELKDPEMRLDVGAIAKGYATEQVALRAEARGVKFMLLSVGGNVRAIGGRGEPSEPWRVSIRNPFEEKMEEQPYVTILNLTDESLVTSGVYERYYMYEGERFHHIIDTQSLRPENNYMSVSVVTPDSGVADALSTAIFNLDIDAGVALVESLENTEALWIMPDGEEVATSGLRDLEYKTEGGS